MLPRQGTFRGEFRHGRRYGKGVFTTADSRFSYQGTFAQKKTINGDVLLELAGQVIQMQRGSFLPIYEGEMRNGLRHGMGL